MLKSYGKKCPLTAKLGFESFFAGLLSVITIAFVLSWAEKDKITRSPGKSRIAYCNFILQTCAHTQWLANCCLDSVLKFAVHVIVGSSCLTGCLQLRQDRLHLRSAHCLLHIKAWLTPMIFLFDTLQFSMSLHVWVYALELCPGTDPRLATRTPRDLFL